MPSPVMIVKVPKLPSGSSGSAPPPPEASGQQRACGVDESRIFVPVLEADGPFVATSHGYDAAALLEHRPEGRIRGRLLDAGIDGRTLQAFGLRPEEKEALGDSGHLLAFAADEDQQGALGGR